MRRVILCLALASGLSCAGATLAGAQEAVFLVRHAERQDNSTDSPLSAEGRARATRLAQMLRDARITAIYVTEFERTAQTAQPLADLLKLPPVRVPAADPGGLVSKLRAADPHARVLIVSHSDRLPTLLRDLGYGEDVTIAAAQYDDLFIVMPGDRPAAPIVIRVHY
jgi:broad specificity phosphatase PhoE